MLLTRGNTYDTILSCIDIDYITKVCYICNIRGKARDTRPTPSNDLQVSYETSRHYWE